MSKLIASAVTVIALCHASTASAASIVVRPGSAQPALPGETIGWGYEIAADPDRDLEFLNSFVDLPILDGQLLDLFDFPAIPAGTTLRLDYDPSGPFGLVELTLSPLLSPGDIVIGRVFLDYVLIDPLGVRPDETAVFELEVSALVSSTSVPEPTCLALFAAAVGALAARRGRRAVFPSES